MIPKRDKKNRRGKITNLYLTGRVLFGLLHLVYKSVGKSLESIYF
jgi:hypothetical protein